MGDYTQTEFGRQRDELASEWYKNLDDEEKKVVDKAMRNLSSAKLTKVDVMSMLHLVVALECAGAVGWIGGKNG